VSFDLSPGTPRLRKFVRVRLPVGSGNLSSLMDGPVTQIECPSTNQHGVWINPAPRFLYEKWSDGKLNRPGLLLRLIVHDAAALGFEVGTSNAAVIVS
jgi:hypothetical protein